METTSKSYITKLVQVGYPGGSMFTELGQDEKCDRQSLPQVSPGPWAYMEIRLFTKCSNSTLRWTSVVLISLYLGFRVQGFGQMFLFVCLLVFFLALDSCMYRTQVEIKLGPHWPKHFHLARSHFTRNIPSLKTSLTTDQASVQQLPFIEI